MPMWKVEMKYQVQVYLTICLHLHHQWHCPEKMQKITKKLPMGELVDPKKLAPLVTYLLSFSSGIITGAIINYDQQIIGAVPE